MDARLNLPQSVMTFSVERGNSVLEMIQVPFYGETGLNAGIMHMDLDRMRDIPDGWTRANMAMHDKFRTRIKLADQVRIARSPSDLYNFLIFQDILNILFHFYPDMLYELPCEWNYRVWQCSQVFKIEIKSRK